MFKKTIKYTDFNNEERTEDFYFHLSDADLLEMELSRRGGLSEALKKIVNEKDPKEIVKIFKWIILSAYGVKSEDGRRFSKTDEIRASFTECTAFSNLFMELATDAKASSEFVNNLVTAERLANAQARVNQPALPVTPENLEAFKAAEEARAPQYAQPQFGAAVQTVTDGPGEGARFA